MLNFKISELIHSDLANKHNINNMPDVDSLDNLLNLIFYCLQPIRNLLSKPVIVTSGFRSKKLNTLVGGARNSYHLKGMACDFIVKGMSVDEVIKLIKKSNIPYNELINEYDKWIHIAFFL